MQCLDVIAALSIPEGCNDSSIESLKDLTPERVIYNIAKIGTTPTPMIHVTPSGFLISGASCYNHVIPSGFTCCTAHGSIIGLSC